MQGIERTTQARLRDHERAELAEILREFAGQRGQFTARYHSDEGDTMAWFLLLFVGGVVGLVACLVEGVPQYVLATFDFGFADGLLRAFVDPLALGFVGALVATIGSAATFLRVHGRCGTAVTSFGVTTVFGARLRLLRWECIASASRRQVGSRRRFSVLTLVAKDGGRFVTYATPLMEAIEARVRASGGA